MTIQATLAEAATLIRACEKRQHKHKIMPCATCVLDKVCMGREGIVNMLEIIPVEMHDNILEEDEIHDTV